MESPIHKNYTKQLYKIDYNKGIVWIPLFDFHHNVKGWTVIDLDDLDRVNNIVSQEKSTNEKIG
jgi:hypothetical protein